MGLFDLSHETKGAMFSLFANPNQAFAAVSPDLGQLAQDIGCTLGAAGAGE